MAKQIVFESSYLYVPTFEYQPVGLLVNQEKCWGEKVVILGRKLTINSAVEEERQKDYGFTPDILVDIGGRQLAVEVFYTNPVQDEKLRRQLSEQEKQKEHSLMVAQQKLNRETEQRITQKSTRKRTIEMLAAEFRMYETYGGIGRLCSICLLVSNVLDGVDCPFCDGSMFKEKILDNESMRNALYIYRCSPNPSISIKNIQLLKNFEQLEAWIPKAEKIIDA